MLANQKIAGKNLSFVSQSIAYLSKKFVFLATDLS